MGVAYFQAKCQMIISVKNVMYFSLKLQYGYGKYRESWNLRDRYDYWYYRIYSLQWNKRSLLAVLLPRSRWRRSLCSNESHESRTVQDYTPESGRLLLPRSNLWRSLLCSTQFGFKNSLPGTLLVALKSDLCLGVEHIIITLKRCCERNTLEVY